MTRILGIETSCDESATAIVENGRRVLCNLIATQFDVHAKYGGVVPELASRAHVEKLDLLVREALQQAALSPGEIDAIAVTRGPGLIGSLLIGVTAAKTLAWAWNKPLIGVNHIHAHATSAAIDIEHDPWPAIALVVSGGHTSLYHVVSPLDVRLLGGTIDDAAGEAFDKVSTILNLGFPGGPVVDRRAKTGNPKAVNLPRTRLNRAELDFSFSGIKTAVLYHVHGAGKTSGGLERLTDSMIDDICASFSAAVVDVLVEKTMLAVEQTRAKCVVVGGGVAANSLLRERLTQACQTHRPAAISLHLTPMKYCTDNAAMIAALGYHAYQAGRRDTIGLTAVANVSKL